MGEAFRIELSAFYEPMFRVSGPTGHENLAQGLPWVSRNKRFALKGLEMTTRLVQRFGADSRRAGGPFRANLVGVNYPG